MTKIYESFGPCWGLVEQGRGWRWEEPWRVSQQAEETFLNKSSFSQSRHLNCPGKEVDLGGDFVALLPFLTLAFAYTYLIVSQISNFDTSKCLNIFSFLFYACFHLYLDQTMENIKCSYKRISEYILLFHTCFHIHLNHISLFMIFGCDSLS